MQLVYDKNGNGRFDDGEPAVAVSQGVNAKTVKFALKKEYANYPVNELHHFIIVTDVKYESEDGDIPLDTTFNFFIENTGSFTFGNVANITSEMASDSLDFAHFSFEPTIDSFIFTKTSVEPSIPPLSQINRNPVSIMQIRAKAVGVENSIKKIRLHTTSKSVKFKEGIESIDIYLDVDKDGSYEKERKLASVSPDEISQNLDVALNSPLHFDAGEENTLLIVAKFNIPKDAMAQIEIQRGKVTLDNSMEVIGLPVKSKEFTYKCEEGDFTCMDEDEGSCAVTAIDDTNAGIFAIIMAVAAALFFGFAFASRKFSEK